LATVFATLADNPGNARDLLDAFNGQSMVEAANATAVFNASIPAVYPVSLIEAASAAAVQDATKGAVGATWDTATVSAVTLSGGNLVVTNTGTTSTNQGAHVALSSAKNAGKYYFEITLTTYTGGAGVGVGVSDGSLTYSSMSAGPTYGQMCFAVGHTGSGTIFSGSAGNTGLSLGACTSGSVICVAADFTSDNRRVWFRKGAAGPWNGGGGADPTVGHGTGGGLVMISGAIVPYVTFGSGPAGAAGVAGNVFTANFGATSFVGTPPTGYTAGWPT
jgi:hypothetical protein